MVSRTAKYYHAHPEARKKKAAYDKKLEAVNALEKIEQEYADSPEARHFVDFIRRTERGIMPGDPALIAIGGSHLQDHDEENL